MHITLNGRIFKAITKIFEIFGSPEKPPVAFACGGVQNRRASFYLNQGYVGLRVTAPVTGDAKNPFPVDNSFSVSNIGRTVTLSLDDEKTIAVSGNHNVKLSSHWPSATLKFPSLKKMVFVGEVSRSKLSEFAWLGSHTHIATAHEFTGFVMYDPKKQKWLATNGHRALMVEQELPVAGRFSFCGSLPAKIAASAKIFGIDGFQLFVTENRKFVCFRGANAFCTVEWIGQTYLGKFPYSTLVLATPDPVHEIKCRVDRLAVKKALHKLFENYVVIEDEYPSFMFEIAGDNLHLSQLGDNPKTETLRPITKIPMAVKTAFNYAYFLGLLNAFATERITLRFHSDPVGPVFAAENGVRYWLMPIDLTKKN